MKIKPKMTGDELMCSGDCGQYYFHNDKHCCKLGDYKDIYVCIPGLRKQRDAALAREKALDRLLCGTRRELCFEWVHGNDAQARKFAGLRGWYDCFDNDCFDGDK